MIFSTFSHVMVIFVTRGYPWSLVVIRGPFVVIRGPLVVIRGHSYKVLDKILNTNTKVPHFDNSLKF